MTKINHLAVIVAAVLYWILGGAWYAMFTAPFVRLMRWTPEDMARIEAESHARELGAAFVTSLVTAYVLAYFVRAVGARSALDGVRVALLACVGFVLTTNLSSVLFESRPLGLYLINNGYHLVAFLLMGALLAAWRRQEVNSLAYQN
ncbi:MAG TPA: DUF1761 domain-containing protein [Pyrinomonadaceae bacterium]|nr:DUF1761 domain-containing protein [Pyrinomonadaceae bacterium]